MLIENPDAFKAWLTSILEPLCDADPEALAKYVYALVKKEKPVDVLRDVMIEQLDVFLQKETVSFVELLFKTLEKQEYLLPPTVIPNANPPNPNVVPKLEPVEAPVQKDIKPIIPVSSLPNLTLDNINGISNVKKEKEPETQKKDKEREHKKSDSEKEEKTRVSRNRHRSTSRNRSRSRSWERSRRSRSRDRSRDRERRDRSRPWRNKSPPKRYDRRRSRSNSPPVPRNRSRSPRHNYRIRYRNRSPTRSVTRSRSRSYEKQLDKEKVKERKEVSRDPLSGAGTPTQDSNHGDTDMRLTSSTQSIQSVVAANPDGSLPTTTVAGVFQSKRRCRDFDEKGYCMRGELCPYDHGVDPVVLEDTALTSVLTFGPNGQPPIDGKDKHKFHSSKLPRHPPIGLLPPPLVRPNSGHMMQPHHMPPRPLHAAMPPEYNPSAPSMWNARPGFRGPMGPRGAGPAMFHGMHNSGPIMGVPQGAVVGSHNHVQRELISVPVIDNSGPVSDGVYPRTSDYMMIHDNNNLKKKQGFDFNRLGPRSKNPINCSLELKKVPRGLNNITHLNNHFTKFGKIVNIQVNFEGDPEAALITFSSHAEANAAYRSTEAVLNNRFIKVFWHNSGEGKQENLPSLQRSIKERLGQTGSPLVQANSNKVLNLVQPKATPPADSDSPKVENEPPSKLTKTRKEQSDEIKVQAIMKNQEILAAKEQLKRKQEEKRKEAVKLTHDLIKRKQELLDKQISQQKILIKKLEDGQVKGQQRDDLMKAINTLQQSIEEIRKSLIDTVKQTSNKPMAKLNQAAKITQIRKSKEETQKEILDTELDLITKQQEGVDTSELQLKLTELKKKAHVLGLPSRRGYASLRVPRGNKFLRAARHSFSHSNSTVDHRPTKVLISGYESDEKVEVIAHFSKYGNIVDYVTDDSTPSVVLNFKTRKEAEMALLKGKQFQDRTLSVTWCNNLQLSNQLSNTRHTTRTVLLESDEDHLLDCTIPEEEPNLEGLEGVDLSEEALLQDDEEEEEENEEDRSWRR